MKRYKTIILLSLLWFNCVAAPFSNAGSRPNIVIILADDMGYGDPGCYNPDSKIATPGIDRIARNGMRFTDAHTPSSVCTPTRYTLLTGQYCWRTRLKTSVLDGFSPPLIDAKTETIASFLKNRGYQTACIGKWHLGMQWTRKDGSLENEDRSKKRGFRSGENIDFLKKIKSGPLTAGFESFIGISASLDMAPYCWIENDRCTPVPDHFVPSRQDTSFLNQSAGAASSSFSVNAVLPELKRRAVQWITKQQAKANEQKEKQPFFLYLPLNSPHLPVAPSKAFAGKSKVGIYGDFVMETDDCIGAVLDALEKTGMADNTLVLFTSDNGGLFHDWTPKEKDDLKNYKPKARGLYTKQFGHQSNAHLRGTKADIWEGGHRVPFLIQWPNRVKPDKVCDEPIELTDVFATIAEIVDGSIPDGDKAPDSFSFLSELESKPTGKAIRPFLIHHSLYGMFSLRQGDWKYIEARGSGGFTRLRKVKPKPQEPTTQLYNLANDPSETLNLAGQKVEISKRLGLLLEKAKLDARLRQ